MNTFQGVNRIIFDLDNTIFKHDTQREIEQISNYLDIPYNELEKQLESFFKDNYKYTKSREITEDYFEFVVESMIPVLAHYSVRGKKLLEAIENSTTITLMENAEDLLRYLYNEGYYLVVLSNWFRTNQIKTLKRLGILKYFEQIYGWDNYYSKPHEKALIRALGGTDKTQNLYIGDNVVDDIAFAQKCGLRTIGFNLCYDNVPEKYQSVKPDLHVSNLADIMKYL